MSLTNREQMAEVLNEMKIGTILTERKSNGEKYSGHFYLHKYEQFVSFNQSEKSSIQPFHCKFYWIN